MSKVEREESAAPKRIQRKRTKGWKMPPNTVYVGRPTLFGNPFSGALWRELQPEIMLTLYKNMFYGWDANVIREFTDDWVHMVYEEHMTFVNRFYRKNPLEYAEFVLRGKDLACWCPLDLPCHADVLLEIANAKTS